MTVIDYDDEGNIVQVREVPGLLPPHRAHVPAIFPIPPPWGQESEEHAKNANPLVLDAQTCALAALSMRITVRFAMVAMAMSITISAINGAVQVSTMTSWLKRRMDTFLM